MDAVAASEVWAASGAAGLSGHADGPPLDVPLGLVHRSIEWAEEIEQWSAALGTRVRVDGPALLGERAALAGFRRNGRTSCGGASRLVRAADGWFAVSLARDADVEAVPAWLDAAIDGDAWSTIAEVARRRGAADLVERGVLLGLPIGRLGELTARPAPPVRAQRLRAAPTRHTLAGALVVDLSAMWAGPLAANLLGDAGARVVKVESATRPDGARRGAAVFYDLLHAGHESICLDFGDAADLAALRRLLGAADIVIESSRPRALRHLGLDVEHVVGPKVWLAISAHGRRGEAAARVGFGDDAAVAGGLVARDPVAGEPCFCCDAVADPLTGMAAAASVLDAYAAEGAWFLDVSLAATAAAASGRETTRIADLDIAIPRARPSRAFAAPIGAHTDAVLRELA